MKILDKVLSSIGLVRKSRHLSVVESHRHFTALLAGEAQTAGIKVLLNNQVLQDIQLDTSVFVLGSRNVLKNIDLLGSKIYTGPDCRENLLIGIRATPKVNPERAQ